MRLFSAGDSMSCILSQMNSMTGQGLGPKSQYRVVRGSMDQVSFAGTRKIELRRSSEVHFWTQESGSGSLAQRRSDRELSWLVISRKWEKGPGSWVK